MSHAEHAPKLDPLPYMHPNEIQMYERRLRAASRVCEFGSGASTTFALRTGIKRIVSVESDAAWLGLMRRDPIIREAAADGRLHLLHADIGPVERWGFPVDRQDKARWRAYPEAPWPTWEALNEEPDLVLVDGRFRIACCLRSLQWWLNSGRNENFTILLHDVGDKRPGYAIAFDWLELVERSESLCAFRPRVPPSSSDLATAYAKAANTPL